MIERAESARLRQRLAARPASAAGYLVADRDARRGHQRTNRIELGTAVIPLGLENPLRLAEDLATVDILCGRPDQPGSVGRCAHAVRHYKTKLYPERHELENFSKDRVLRLLECLRGDRSATSRARSASSSSPGGCSHTRRGWPIARVVRRRLVIGDLGGRAGHQLSDELGSEHRGNRFARLRDHSGRADRRVPRAPPVIPKIARVCRVW